MSADKRKEEEARRSAEDPPEYFGTSMGKPSLDEAFDNAFANIPSESKSNPCGFEASITVYGSNPITEYRVGLKPNA